MAVEDFSKSTLNGMLYEGALGGTRIDKGGLKFGETQKPAKLKSKVPKSDFVQK